MNSPLVPSDINLRDFAFMPLDVVRLRDSDFAAISSGEAFRAGILLWCAAWHQVPAGSLPSDDRALASLAGFGRFPKEWAKVKDDALHGWILCSDGRLYHPVICEKAMESWQSKQQHHYNRFADRLRKSNKKLEDAGLEIVEIPQIDVWILAGSPKDWGKNSNSVPSEFQKNSGGIPSNSVLKGQGQGQGQGYINTLSQNTDEQKSEKHQANDSNDPNDWKPDIEVLNTKLKLAGANSIDQTTLEQTLVTFNPHYESQHLSDNQKLAKLVSWIKRERQTPAPVPSKNKSSPAKTQPNRNVNDSWPEIPEHEPAVDNLVLPEDVL